MNSPIVKTLFMAVVALVASAAAAAFYPWPERVVVSDVIDKPLFESYDSDSVRSIQITEFSEDNDGLEVITLRRSAEKWIIPAYKNFVATNARQIAAAANCLNDRKVLIKQTDKQQDYLEYGVMDPQEYQTTTNRSGLGVKIELENRNGQEIASLIVGKQQKDDPKGLKHFVRIPGQPNVYVIDFERVALSTDFRRWVDSNLFRVGAAPVDTIRVENYRINPDAIAGAKRELSYRAELGLESSGIALRSIERGANDGSWAKAPMTPEINQQLQSVPQQAVGVQFTDVRKKSAALAKLFTEFDAKLDAKILSSLQPLGFVKTGEKFGAYDFDATGGEVTLRFKDGVIVTLFIGNNVKQAGASSLSYFAMLVAGFDDSAFPEPKKPETKDDASDEDQAKAEKEFLKLTKTRDDAVKSAQRRVSVVNQLHADWVYVLPEEVVANLRPEADLGAGLETPGGLLIDRNAGADNKK